MKFYKHEVVRYLHLLFCFVLLVLRSGLLYMAITIRWNLFHFNAFLHSYVTGLVFYLISSCPIFLLLSLLGIYAAITSKRRIFITYSVILVVLYLIELVVYGIAVNIWLNFNTAIEEAMDHHIVNYESNPVDIDYLQKTLMCCGKYNETEWFTAISYIPFSCCPDRPQQETTESFCSILDIFFIFHTGCLKELQGIPRPGLTIITSLLISITGIEMLSLCLSSYAARIISPASALNINTIKQRKMKNNSTEIVHLNNQKQNNLRTTLTPVSTLGTQSKKPSMQNLGINFTHNIHSTKL